MKTFLADLWVVMGALCYGLVFGLIFKYGGYYILISSNVHFTVDEAQELSFWAALGVGTMMAVVWIWESFNPQPDEPAKGSSKNGKRNV